MRFNPWIYKEDRGNKTRSGNYLDIDTGPNEAGPVPSDNSTLLVTVSLLGQGGIFPQAKIFQENYSLVLLFLLIFLFCFVLMVEKVNFFQSTINKVFQGQAPNEIITVKAATKTSVFENVLKT